MNTVLQPVGLLTLLLLLPVVQPWQLPRISKLWRLTQQELPIVRFVDDSCHTESNDNTIPGVSQIDSHFMTLALDEAKKAGQRGEVPIGALVVRSVDPDTDGYATDSSIKTSMFQILSADSNRVEERRDASAHAEILAMRHAAANNQDASWRLLNTTLYTTVEPCVMCLAAAQAFRVGRVVYGAPDLRLGAIDTYMNLLEHPHPFHTIEDVERGVYQEESAELLRSFFRTQREKRQEAKKAKGARSSKWKSLLLFWRS